MTIHRHTSHTHKHASTHVIRGTKASHRPHVSRYDILVSAARERHAGKLQQVRAPLHLPSSPCLRLFISSPRSRVRVRAHENILGQLQVPCAASWGSAWACPASCPLPPMPMECAARIPVAVCVCGCAHATARARANARCTRMHAAWHGGGAQSAWQARTAQLAAAHLASTSSPTPACRSPPGAALHEHNHRMRHAAA